MFDNLKKQRQLDREWSSIVVKLSSVQINVSIGQEVTNWIIDVIAKSLNRYALGYSLKKRTFKLIAIVKRILADKRHFELLKAVDYLIGCHNISKYRIPKTAKRQAIAYFCQWAIEYIKITKQGFISNPFHPGQVLRRVEDIAKGLGNERSN